MIGPALLTCDGFTREAAGRQDRQTKPREYNSRLDKQKERPNQYYLVER